jgi:hypothetical protein
MPLGGMPVPVALLAAFTAALALMGFATDQCPLLAVGAPCLLH